MVLADPLPRCKRLGGARLLMRGVGVVDDAGGDCLHQMMQPVEHALVAHLVGKCVDLGEDWVRGVQRRKSRGLATSPRLPTTPILSKVSTSPVAVRIRAS